MTQIWPKDNREAQDMFCIAVRAETCNPRHTPTSILADVDRVSALGFAVTENNTPNYDIECMWFRTEDEALRHAQELIRSRSLYEWYVGQTIIYYLKVLNKKRPYVIAEDECPSCGYRPCKIKDIWPNVICPNCDSEAED